MAHAQYAHRLRIENGEHKPHHAGGSSGCEQIGLASYFSDIKMPNSKVKGPGGF
jgi:hypothetical protein